MRYLFKHMPDDDDVIFKVAFDIMINFRNEIQSFKDLIDKEDIIMDSSGFSFHDEYNRPTEEIVVWYLEYEKKYSKEEFHQLLTMAISKYFSIYSEGKDEITKIFNF